MRSALRNSVHDGWKVTARDRGSKSSDVASFCQTNVIMIGVVKPWRQSAERQWKNGGGRMASKLRARARAGLGWLVVTQKSKKTKRGVDSVMTDPDHVLHKCLAFIIPDHFPKQRYIITLQ